MVCRKRAVTVTVTVADASIHDVLADRAIRAVFQPVVDLDTGDVVAVEALARGPKGTAFESPGNLFAAAHAAGVTRELDWACRAAAVEAALDASLPHQIRLFLNAEPRSLMTPCPDEHRDLFRAAVDQLSIVIEVTERHLSARPADLIAALAEMRALGLGVAIDDVGVDPMSLAFLPFIEPDVIKLDMSLVHEPMNRRIAALAAAIGADAERRGAVVLAEGIETAQHRERATILGASLGQGWLLGRPTSLEELAPRLRPRDGEQRPRLSFLRSGLGPLQRTPWDLVADSPRRRTTTKSLLMPMSHHIEQSATWSPDSVLLGTFQHRRHYTPATDQRYQRLAARCGLVGAIAVGLVQSSDSPVRFADLTEHHPLAEQWCVVVIGPHQACALIAREIGGDVPDADRPFDYVVTHDRDLVIAAARSLMRYLVPSEPGNPVPRTLQPSRSETVSGATHRVLTPGEIRR